MVGSEFSNFMGVLWWVVFNIEVCGYLFVIGDVLKVLWFVEDVVCVWSSILGFDD